MKYLGFILLVCHSCFCFSQTQRCSTDEYRENLKNKGLYNYNKTYTSSTNIYTGNYVIPVVVHVLYNNEEENIYDDKQNCHIMESNSCPSLPNTLKAH